jgi:hypothetical protein
VIELLLCKHEALSSNTSATKTKQNEQIKNYNGIPFSCQLEWLLLERKEQVLV